MKKILTALTMGAVLSGVCFADSGKHRVEIKKIESTIQQTPQFEVAGVRNKRVNPRHWLEIEAELEVETTAKSEFIPAITAHWFAVVMKRVEGKPVPVRLTGRVEFVNISTKDGKAYISAYIGPDVLEKLTGENKPRENDIEGIALKIQGNGIVSDGKHAAGLVYATKEKSAKWWDNWKRETLKGTITPKSETPFAPLWTDRYPAEKKD